MIWYCELYFEDIDQIRQGYMYICNKVLSYFENVGRYERRLVNQKYLIYPDVFLRYVALWLYMISNCLTPKAFIKDGL